MITYLLIEMKQFTHYRANYCSIEAVCLIVGPPLLIEFAIMAIASGLGSGGKSWKTWSSNLRSSPMREDQANGREDRQLDISNARNKSIKNLYLLSALGLSIKLTPSSR